MTAEERREYYRQWYLRKRQDPEWVAKRNAEQRESYKTDHGRRSYMRAWAAARRRAAGIPERNGKGSLVPLADQKARANELRRERYATDPEFRAYMAAATKASREKRIANETPEDRERRMARQRRNEKRYRAKRKAVQP